MPELKTIGWIIAIVLVLGLGFLLFSGTKFTDCKDGGALTTNPNDCAKAWCSTLNKRIELGEDCPLSICADGSTTTNLFNCPKYTCDDNSVVDKPDNCQKYTCPDGTITGSLKLCNNYCEQAEDCNPTKANAQSCFGKWACESNQCTWKCEEQFSKASAKEIALSLDEMVQDGYSIIGEEKIEEKDTGTTISSAFENARQKISFAQIIGVSKQGTDKAQLANTFNSMVNGLIKEGIEPIEGVSLGDDSLMIQIPSDKVNQNNLPYLTDTKPNSSYGNTYLAFFRKSNVLVILFIATDTNEKAVEFLSEYGKRIEFRI
jgi:hypothetical protein